MTHSEARLATALAVGIELKKFAAINSISDHTVRAHLKSVMGKMGVHRQIDVVRLVMAGALIRWPPQYSDGRLDYSWHKSFQAREVSPESAGARVVGAEQFH